jgi:membrane fusion protein (multidrug efflux system)
MATDDSDENSSSRRKTILYSVLAVVVAGALAYGGYSYLSGSAPKPETANPAMSRVPVVQVVEPEETSGPVTVEQTAFVRATSQIDVTPEVSGRIASVSDRFETGRFLEEGEIILTLEKGTFEANVQQARASIQDAEARRRQAASNLSRQEQLSSRDFASEATLEDAQTAVLQANAAVATAEASLRQALIALKDAEIVAPFDAYVAEKNASKGQLVQAGQTVGSIIAADTADIEVGMSEDQFELLPDEDALVGSSVTVRSDEGQNVRTRQGRVVSIDPLINPQARTYSVLVRVDDPFGRAEGVKPLRINQLVTVAFPIRQNDELLYQVPVNALQNDSLIWFVDSEGRLRKLDYTLVRQGNNAVYITVSEMASDASIVTSRLNNPYDGQKVRIQSPSNNERPKAEGSETVSETAN